MGLYTDRAITGTNVLIVDQSEDCREVLRTLLEGGGIHTLEAAGARQGLELLRRHAPQLVVLDLETAVEDDAEVRGEYDEGIREGHSELLVLGRARGYRETLPADRVMAKPYHYGPLIRTIETLLQR